MRTVTSREILRLCGKVARLGLLARMGKMRSTPSFLEWSRICQNKLPARDVLPFLKKRGVKDAEIADVNLPAYLVDKNGQVSRKDLQAQVEANQVKVFEKIYKDPEVDPMAYANDLYDNYSAQFGPSINKWPARSTAAYDTGP